MMTTLQATRLIVLMGVSGSGKSTIGEALAPRLNGIFLDGDTFHPAENVAKMSRGQPLTDIDRAPWLRRVGQEMAARSGVVIAGCSALKRAYRETLREAANEPLLFLLLTASRAVLEERMRHREGHFMPASLLESQLAALEPPGPDENAFAVDVGAPTEEVVAAILDRLAAIPVASGFSYPASRL